jgi:hypothetical protein
MARSSLARQKKGSAVSLPKDGLRNASLEKLDVDALRPESRLTLSQAAALVVAEVWPAINDKRTQIDRARKRIKRDYESGKLIGLKDGTFVLTDLATWLRLTWWSGMGRPGEFPNLPGARQLPPIAQYVDKRGRAKGIALSITVIHESPLESLTTVEACHNEIRRLNRLLDTYYQRNEKPFSELPEERIRRAKVAGGKMSAKARWSKE